MRISPPPFSKCNSWPTPTRRTHTLEDLMIYKLLRFLALLGALAGCSALQQKVEMDASAAAIIAENAGDAAGAACFKALEPMVAMAAAGLQSKFEVARASQILIEDGPCAPLAAELLLHLLTKIPGTP